MRTNIVIDDQLMAEAMAISKLPTKRETVDAALRMLIQILNQEEIRRYRGRMTWEGDLDAMRTDAA